MNESRIPALVLPGTPEVIYVPKCQMEVDGEIVTADAMLRLRTGKRKDWVLVEVDEGGIITEESRRREELLGLPTLRISEKDLLRFDFVQHLIRRAQRLLGLQVTGYQGPKSGGEPRRGELVRPPLVRPATGWRKASECDDGDGLKSCS